MRPFWRTPVVTRVIALIIAIVVSVVALPLLQAQTARHGVALARYSFNPNASGLPLPVTINRTSAIFLMDTGCTCSIVDSSFRDHLGEVVRMGRAATPDGMAHTEIYRAPPVAVGGEPVGDISEVGCIDFSRFRCILGSTMNGMLGMDFLRQRIVRIDFDQGELQFLESVPEGSGAPIPIRFSSIRCPTVTVALGGALEETFTIDTGISGTVEGVIGKRLLERLIESGRASNVGSGMAESINGSRTAGTARIKDIGLAEFGHHDLVFGEGARNLLGLGYLSRYIVTFDFPAGRMYLKPGLRFNEPSRYDLSGAHIWRPNGTTSVHSVDRYSAADRADLRAGDLIQEVDAVKAASLTPLQIRKVFCKPGEHTLRVTRGGQDVKIRLNLSEP